MNDSVQRGIENAYGFAAQLAQQAAACWTDAALAHMRPSVLYRASLEEQDGQWLASYGQLIAEGDTPEEAMAAFDKAWREQRAEDE